MTKLAHTGIVKGYPDGEFKGNRMMTRYEFATLVYRAIMGGAASNPDLNKDGTLDKLTKEFEPELKYIRIDVIQKDRDGVPTIERVRTTESGPLSQGREVREKQRDCRRCGSLFAFITKNLYTIL